MPGAGSALRVRFDTPDGDSPGEPAPVTGIRFVLILLVIVRVRELENSVHAAMGKGGDGPDQHAGSDLPVKAVSPPVS